MKIVNLPDFKIRNMQIIQLKQGHISWYNQTSIPESFFRFFPFDTAQFDMLNLLVNPNWYNHIRFHINKSMKTLHSNRRIWGPTF